MRVLVILLCIVFLSSCLKKRRKDEYAGYVGAYQCEIYEYDRVGTQIWDSTYYGEYNLNASGSDAMLFLGMTIPFKYIDEKGLYQQSSLLENSYNGKQITMAGDSIVYVEYDIGTDYEYEKKFTGHKI